MASIETKELGRDNSPRPSRRFREGLVPSYVLLYFPIFLPEKENGKINVREAGMEAFKMGALADRGLVFQNIGGIEPIELNVSDFPVFITDPQKIAPMFSLDDHTIRFLIPSTGLLTDERDNVSEGRVRNWFLRSVTFWNRFMRQEETRDLITLRVGESEFPLSADGLNKAWMAAGLPQYQDPAFINTSLHIPYKKEGVHRGPK